MALPFRWSARVARIKGLMRPAALPRTQRAQREMQHEMAVVEEMVRLYCRRREGNAALCDSCREVLDYALRRLERCPFGYRKPTCKKCLVHCYNPLMRKRIRLIMRWAGPRMAIYHPVDALRHLLREWRRR